MCIGQPSYGVLESFVPVHDYIVGVDSDGCVFPTMDVKQKNCFVPATTSHFGLEPVAEYVRQVIEFVALRSVWRGTNRFPALVIEFDYLRDRPEVRETGVAIPRLDALREFIGSGVPLSNDALEQRVSRTNDPELAHVLKWSHSVNASIAFCAKSVEPFRYVRETIDAISDRADIVVVSATPYDALKREWTEHGLDGYAALIAGQEVGSKREQLERTAGARYKKDNVIMIGDALGDLEAARSTGALFYPINPGDEETSWQRLHNGAADRFFSGTYAGTYERQLIDDFESRLLDTPPWKTEGGL